MVQACVTLVKRSQQMPSVTWIASSGRTSPRVLRFVHNLMFLLQFCIWSLGDLIWGLWVTFSFFGWQHALRLSAFGQLHKVLGMDPLPSKMPRKPRSEIPIDYTGKSEWKWTFFITSCMFCVSNLSIFKQETWLLTSFISIVQIPPSTTYVPPMKRPIEEEEATDEKNPNKKKKKLQKEM